MKRLFAILSFAAIAGLTAMPAAAECYADYKAKRDDPLRLHYGVIALPDAQCKTREDAAQAIVARIGADGWTLLAVVSIFGEAGLNDQKRIESARDYFLRY